MYLSTLFSKKFKKFLKNIFQCCFCIKKGGNRPFYAILTFIYCNKTLDFDALVHKHLFVFCHNIFWQ